jgi:hypothetical protein
MSVESRAKQWNSERNWEGLRMPLCKIALPALGHCPELKLFHVDTPEVHSHSELLLTAYDPQTWRDLWQMKLTARDQPGVVARLTEVLGAQRIQILRADTVTSGRTHLVELAIDCREYRSPLDEDLRKRVWRGRQTLEDLQFLVEASAIDMLAFVGETPSVEIRRNHTLWSIHHDDMLKKRHVEGGFPVTRRGRWVHFSESRLTVVRRQLANRNQVPPNLLVCPIMLPNFDEGDGVCRILVSFKELGIIPLKLYAERDSRLVPALTAMLMASGYDVLSTVMHRAGARTAVSMLLRDLRATIPARSLPLRARLREVLSSAIAWQFDLDIAAPNTKGRRLCIMKKACSLP